MNFPLQTFRIKAWKRNWRVEGTIISNVSEVQKTNFFVSIVITLFSVGTAQFFADQVNIVGIDILGILTLIGAFIYFRTPIARSTRFTLFPIVIAGFSLGALLVFFYQLNTIGGEILKQRLEADQMKKLYEELKKQKELVDKLLEHERVLDQRKNQFISIASHNLRTPLTTIKGYLEFLKRENKDSQDLAGIERGVKNLENLTEELIDIASFEKEELKLHKERVKIEELVGPMLIDYKYVAKIKGVELVAPKNLANLPQVELDTHQVRQALFNLLDNALKFTESGGKTEVSVVKEGKYLVLSVKDNGIGIEKENIKNLFTKFGLLEEGLTYNYRGTGLGLYIAKLIAESHGGKVGVQSTPGKGSTFSIYLPLKD